MKRLLKFALWTIGILAMLGLAGFIFYRTQKTHHTSHAAPAAIKPTGDELVDSIHRAVEFLKVRQEPSGEFSAGLADPKPAFTALVVDALAASPDHLDEKTPFVAKAVTAILSHQQPDGGIYTPVLGMGNYCTSVSVMALKQMKNPAHDEAIARARAYILGIQQPNGGMGYNPSSRADLSNTSMSIEALRAAGVDENSEAFKQAVAFVALCQNNPESNQSDYAKVVTDGGFMYRPGQSKAGEIHLSDGRVGYRSYGLMSYAGLVSFLWAGVDREDPRVKSAFRWVTEHWTLDENYGLKDAGLYYYYLTMAKALETYGQRSITTSDGRVHDWPVELSKKVISLQRADGSWSNSNRQWLEDDSVLTTAYMLKTLSICHKVINAERAATR